MYAKCDTIMMGEKMSKTETIHVRVSPEIKKESETIINEMGLNLSYAISIYLKQIINQKKIPFEITSFNDEMKIKEEELAYAINDTGGKEVNDKCKKIIHLYATNQIDYETALFALKRIC